VSKSIYANFSVTVKDPVSTSDHNAILCYYRNAQPPQKVKKEFFDYRTSNMELFTHSVSQIDWQPFYNSASVDDKCHYFTNSIKHCMSLIPRFEVSMSDKDKTWITPLCKHLINKRWQAFRSHDFEKYKHYKSKVQQEITKAKQLYYLKCKRSNKGMWQFIKKTIKNNQCDIRNLKKEDETLEFLANRINESLILYFNPPTNTSNFQPLKKEDSIHFTLAETFFGLQKLAPNKATGSDGIPNKCLKSVSHYITEPLCHIFNFAIYNHEFPSLWKVADITPVPKTRQILLNKLRPISLLPNIAKIFEQLILKRTISFFHAAIDSHQFGFMPQSSTSACLINIQHAIASYLNSSYVIAISVISFDLEKAFDCLPHSILLEKLVNVLPKNIFYLISSYLSNRFQQVKIMNTRSYPLNITSGVPQGGILSPILFNVFISDLNFGADCKYFKYADDTTVVLPHYADTIASDVNKKVQIMEDWCTNNSLRLNKSKTQILTIKKKKNIHLHTNHSDNIKILGVWFSSDFKWQTQVNYIFKKASQKVHIIRQLKSTLPQKELLILYKTLVLPVLNYGGELYVHLPHNLNKKLNSVGSRCHNIICQKACKCLSLPDESRKLMALKHFKRGLNNPQNALHPIMPTKLPSNKRLSQPFSSNDKVKKCFIPTVTEMFNAVNL